MQGISGDTPCSFASDAEDHDEVELTGIASGPAVGLDEDISMEIIAQTGWRAADDGINRNTTHNSGSHSDG